MTPEKADLDQPEPFFSDIQPVSPSCFPENHFPDSRFRHSSTLSPILPHFVFPDPMNFSSTDTENKEIHPEWPDFDETPSDLSSLYHGPVFSD